MQWICFDCAESAGSKIPEGHFFTCHMDTCDACGKWKEVTEPRDFRPRPDRLVFPQRVSEGVEKAKNDDK